MSIRSAHRTLRISNGGQRWTQKSLVLRFHLLGPGTRSSTWCGACLLGPGHCCLSTSKQLASEHHQWVTTDVVDKSLRELSSHAAKAFMKPPDRLLPPDPFCHSLNFVVRVGRWLQPGGGWQYHRVRGRVHHWTLSIEEYPNPQERHSTWIKGFAKVKTI